LSAIRSVFRFEGTVRAAVHELKYRNLRAIAPCLAAYMCAYMAEWGPEPELVVPVPMHSRHQHRRGYNQAELLARALARSQGLAFRAALKRTSGQASQVRSRSVSERHRNVAGAFTCVDESISGKRILLIDDVCTTGATLEACAAALRAAGASEVSGLTVAREV
jgi:ComF family protein